MTGILLLKQIPIQKSDYYRSHQQRYTHCHQLQQLYNAIDNQKRYFDKM